MFEQFMVDSADKRIDLNEYNPEDTARLSEKGTEEAYGELKKQLEKLQEVFYASRQHALLVVLQGMDCSGKDGAVKKVFACVNPNGLTVQSFKTPTPLELGHDYLWRVHKKTPVKGSMVVFNRSYYEDVLVTRVHKTISDETAFARFGEIRAFEKYLVDNNTVVLKFFLHISKAFQQQKLENRLKNPEKFWKFSEADLNERKFWDAYQKCYCDVLTHCSTKEAPWHIVPANQRWFAHYFILKRVVDTLEGLKLQYPPLAENVSELIREVGESK